MKKQYLFMLSVIIFLGLIFGTYQYFQVFETEEVSAVVVGTPNPGHPWAQMECSSDTLCIDTANKRLGIGTNNPTEKLEVNGNIKASGDICNSTGNCLSAMLSLTNGCGTAATTYAYAAAAYSGSYCVMGFPTPATPAWPAAGASTTWTCPVSSGSPISCTAIHAAAPVNGACGAAATSYVYSASAFSGALCSAGDATPASPIFPAAGSATSWSCVGTGGGTTATCTATRAAAPYALVNTIHTNVDCINAGGTIIGTDTSYYQCKFTAASCPSGWTRYKGYGTYSNPQTGLSYCSGRPAGSCPGTWGDGSGNVLVYYSSCGSSGSWICFGDASYTASYYKVVASGCCFCGSSYCQTITESGCY